MTYRYPQFIHSLTGLVQIPQVSLLRWVLVPLLDLGFLHRKHSSVYVFYLVLFAIMEKKQSCLFLNSLRRSSKLQAFSSECSCLSPAPLPAMFNWLLLMDTKCFTCLRKGELPNTDESFYSNLFQGSIGGGIPCYEIFIDSSGCMQRGRCCFPGKMRRNK